MPWICQTQNEMQMTGSRLSDPSLNHKFLNLYSCRFQLWANVCSFLGESNHWSCPQIYDVFLSPITKEWGRNQGSSILRPRANTGIWWFHGFMVSFLPFQALMRFSPLSDFTGEWNEFVGKGSKTIFCIGDWESDIMNKEQISSFAWQTNVCRQWNSWCIFTT